VTGLRPKQRVRLSATTRDAAGKGWRSRLVFKATLNGIVDTRSNMRLFWSMQPTRATGSIPLVPPLGPAEVRIRAYVDKRLIASGGLVRRAEARDVSAQNTSLAIEGFVGTYFRRPPGPPVPAVLQLGGSFGGHGDLPAALLASHGYPTLSLGYFKEPGLPKTLKDIPLEYFAKALRWLAVQPGVDSSRVVVAGVSRGGEAALLLGATYPELVHGVMACTPSASVLPAYPGPGNAWTYGGDPVPQGPISIERIAGPVLATGGGKDAVWPSAGEVREIIQRARRYGRHDIVGHIYPKAGHSVGCAIPYLPLASVRFGRTAWLPFGGTQASNAQARAASWPLLLRFLATLPHAV
jgi:dienelactone hydrolase